MKGYIWRGCTTIYLCAQLHRWSANYTFKPDIVCYRA